MELRDRILASPDRKVGEVHVPQWNETLRIMELSAKQRMEMLSWFAVDDPEDGAETPSRQRLSADQMATIVAWGVVDANGDRVFSDEDVPALAEKSLGALNTIFGAITDISSTPEEAEGN